MNLVLYIFRRRSSCALRLLALPCALNRVFALFLILACTNGCLSTVIQSELPAAGLVELASGSSRPLKVYVKQTASNYAVGYQYLFFVIPFGVVRTPRLTDDIEQVLFRELSLKGYKPLIVSNEPEDQRTLIVELHEIDVSAYDYLFFRHIVSSVSFTGELRSFRSTSRRVGPVTGRATAFKEFAFGPQLEHYFQKSLTIATQNLLTELRL
ncbi:MAG: hypothetical protein KDD42_08670 [Bdellovibrionales bacterium]|nr:hypothetical protein [Bdellovibrionales bacterium]